MHKFFIDKNNISSDIAKIVGDDVKHIYKVLRLEEGDKIVINNTCGEEFIGEILDITKSEVQVKLVEKNDVNNESPIDITLFQGLPKSVKMDLITQKSVELGINNITPIITNRVVVKNELGDFKKVDRWNRIALEACKQSKRTFIPKIQQPIEFTQLLNDLKSFDAIFVPYENAENYGLKAALKEINNSIKKVAIIIGPEGGFEEEEIQSLKDIGAKIVTLGPRILRTETAGFVCASILQYEIGDVGGNC